MAASSDLPAIVEFGRFRVLPHRRELLADGRPIDLGSRAFDVLMVLIEARGELVTKSELLRRVWPGTFVEENNLHIQISALRKALGEERGAIQNHPGRGYRFVAEIVGARAEPERSVFAARLATNLPAPTSELIGRDAEVSELVDLMAAHRLVTLSGPGGIGKTRLATEVARRLAPQFGDGAWLAELAPLANPDLLAAAVVIALGLEPSPGAVVPDAVVASLGTKHLLLVLDNCEHVIGAAAAFVEALLHANPSARVLATSREPLRAESEYAFHVPPLAVPAENCRDMEDVLQHGATRLFLERVRGADTHFGLDTRFPEVAGAICRRLDGIPLAIELAAARAATLGVEEVAKRLDDRFRLLTGGRRTALPRHQTLKATLDWSYELLSAQERLVLHRLAIFVGAFSLEAACRVTALGGLDAPDVVEGITSLVAKSLVAADVASRVAPYQLLETTRAYALEKLLESGEFAEVAQAHAAYHRDLLDRAGAELDGLSTGEWRATYGGRIDDVRAALDWAFSPTGDASIGLSLTVAAVPLWFQLSLLEECRGRVQRALASIAIASNGDARLEMQLLAALGASLMHTRGLVRETEAAWTRVLEIAERLDDAEYRMRALHGMWSYRNNSGEFRTALGLARKFCNLAATRPDPTDRLIGDRMIGTVLHYRGDQVGARRHLERALRGDSAHPHRSNSIRSLLDQRVRALATMARVLWLQGFPDQAMRAMASSVEDARSSIDPVIALCYALAQAAIPLALRVGDLPTAARYVAMLFDHSEKHGLPEWQTRARGFDGMLRIERGDVEAGLGILESALDDLRDRRSGLYHMGFQAARAEALGRAGRPAQGLEVIERARAQSAPTGERMWAAELLRIKGVLFRLEDAPEAAAAAEACFRLALGWARRQGALAWELRAATDLARLWRDQAKTRDAHDLLTPLCKRFAEGFDTTDVAAAKSLIDDLRPPRVIGL